MITEELIKKVTLLANIELHETVLFEHIEEWQTRYILKALESVQQTERRKRQ